MADSSQDTPDRLERSVSPNLTKECVCPGSSGSGTSYLLPAGTASSIRIGNPHYGRRMQLYCRTGFHLVVYEDTNVEGVDADMYEFAIMEFTSVDFGGLVRIKGVKSNLYLAMNKKGRLYGEPNPEKEETVFIEGVIGQYNTYMSHMFRKFKWYVGIKKNGRQKPGHKTKWGQKSIQFLPRRID